MPLTRSTGKKLYRIEVRHEPQRNTPSLETSIGFSKVTDVFGDKHYSISNEAHLALEHKISDGLNLEKN